MIVNTYIFLMFGTLLILAVICAVTWLYVRWTRVRQYWAKRGVPHLPPHPVMGSLTFLQRQNPTIWMIDMYQKFKSPYTGVWWFWRPVLLINSPELARNVLVKDAANFRDRFTSSGASDPIGGLNLFTIKDPQWSSVRRHLTNVFTASKLKALQDLFTSKSKDLIHVLKTSEDNSKINLRYLLTDFTTDIIGTAAFGVKTNAILTGEDSMRLVTKAFMEFNWYRGLCWSSVFFFPELVDIFRFTVFPKWATDYFKKVLRIASKQRREELKDLSSPRDLLDALLTLKENDKQDMSDDLVVAQAALFLFAGFDTSGSSLTFSIYELAFQPELQDKLYEEISKVEGELDLTKLGELVYLNCVIKEGLRKYAPLGWLDRIAAKDYQVDDKLTIPAGTPVYVNGIGMHYDEDLFPEPRKFIPDRFLPENERNIKPFTFMPFGEGPRNCIGKRFGLIVLRHALAYLILNFKMVPLPNGPKPDEIEFDKHSLILAPGQNVNLQFIPRN